MENEYVLMVIMVTFIIGISATEMFKHYLKARQFGVGAADDSHLKDKVTQLSLQNQALIERVQVLEKIVTEPEYELKQQINQLWALNEQNNKAIEFQWLYCFYKLDRSLLSLRPEWLDHGFVAL